MLNRLKLRRDSEIDDRIAHETTVIDSALSGVGGQGADDAGLMNFATLVRDSRPRPADGQFAARMDERFVGRGNASPGRSAGPVADRLGRWASLALRPAPLAGALAAVVLGASVVTLSGGALL
ncbi:MAG: hypothetical protein WAP37_02045, partial [Solirubrobacterales bacterium]